LKVRSPDREDFRQKWPGTNLDIAGGRRQSVIYGEVP
jgi:hypothetical protein